MMCYSIEPRDRIFVKIFGFMPYAQNMGKNISKNINKHFDSKYSHKVLDHVKQSATEESCL